MKNTRLTKWHLEGRRKNEADQIQRSLYAHMLIEDLHLGVMPMEGLRPSGYHVILEPSSQESIDHICFGLPSEYGEPGDPTRALEDFIRYVAQVIGYDGEAFFEIVFFYEQEHQSPRRFRLEPIPIQTLRRRRRTYVQEGYYTDGRSNTRKKLRTEIPQESIAHFTFPSILSTPRKHRSVLDQLVRLSDISMTPTFAMPSRGPQPWPSYFDFSRYNAMLNSEVFRITRHLGWAAREYDNPNTTEFFSVFRFLKFEMTKAFLREETVRILNGTLEIIGAVIPPTIRIQVAGLPSSSEIQTAIADLFEGRIGFNEAINLAKAESGKT